MQTDVCVCVNLFFGPFLMHQKQRSKVLLWHSYVQILVWCRGVDWLGICGKPHGRWRSGSEKRGKRQPGAFRETQRVESQQGFFQPIESIASGVSFYPPNWPSYFVEFTRKIPKAPLFFPSLVKRWVEARKTKAWPDIERKIGFRTERSHHHPGN